MDVGSFPKRRERVGMPLLSLQGCIHGVSQQQMPNSLTHYLRYINPILYVLIFLLLREHDFGTYHGDTP